MAAQQLSEIGSSGHGQAGVVAAFRNAGIPRGIERGNLLDCQPLPLLQRKGEVVGNKSGLLEKRAVHLNNLAVAQHPGAGGEADPYV